jgi:hypothetical protein
MTLMWLACSLFSAACCTLPISQFGEADSVVERDFARDPVTLWNLKGRRVAFGSNRIGPELRWSRLAPLSCRPGLPSESETNSGTLSGRCALSAEVSVLEPCLLRAPLRHADGP